LIVTEDDTFVDTLLPKRQRAVLLPQRAETLAASLRELSVNVDAR